MNLTRNLKEGMTGADVRTVKDRLFALGYYAKTVKKITHDRFGADTTTAVKAFQKAKGLDDDGIVGALTWGALFPAEKERTLKFLMSGDDVLELKNNLFKLGFYPSKITKITNNRFGADTVTAVKAFQARYSLTVDGIVGEKTRAMLADVLSGKTVSDPGTDYVTAAKYPRIGEAARNAINTALKGVSAKRREFVLEALKHATDASIASQFAYPSSLYIRGGNLYGKDCKTLNIITKKYLTSTYKKKYADYCTNGRIEMMIKAVEANPDTTGSDCSGGPVGLARYFGYVEGSFDDTANGLLGGHSKAISKAELTAGDFIGKSGHICIYAGGGYMIEWVGGEYGCQLTEVSKRWAWSYTRKKMIKTLSACKKYRKPKWFD